MELHADTIDRDAEGGGGDSGGGDDGDGGGIQVDFLNNFGQHALPANDPGERVSE